MLSKTGDSWYEGSATTETIPLVAAVPVETVSNRSVEECGGGDVDDALPLEEVPLVIPVVLLPPPVVEYVEVDETTSPPRTRKEGKREWKRKWKLLKKECREMKRAAKQEAKTMKKEFKQETKILKRSARNVTAALTDDWKENLKEEKKAVKEGAKVLKKQVKLIIQQRKLHLKQLKLSSMASSSCAGRSCQ
jgi:hypothetical protein